MDVSLFKRLSERHPHAVVSLEHQYRMNQDIMELSNTLIYEHRLKCGTEGVSRALLQLPNWDELLSYVRENTADGTGTRGFCFVLSCFCCFLVVFGIFSWFLVSLFISSVENNLEKAWKFFSHFSDSKSCRNNVSDSSQFFCMHIKSDI